MLRPSDEAIRRYGSNRDLGWRAFDAGSLTTEARPTSAHIVLTYACNARCKFCSQTTANRAVRLPDAGVEAVFSLAPYLNDLDLQGGEVFADRRLGGILEHLQRDSVTPALRVITNGIAFTPIEALAACAIPYKQIAFSLNAATADTYHYLHGVDAFEKVTGNIRQLAETRREAYPLLIMRMLVMRRNFREIPEFLRLGREAKADQVQLVPLHRAPGIGEFVDAETLPPEEVPDCARLFYDAITAENPFHVYAVSVYSEVSAAIQEATKLLRSSGRPMQVVSPPLPAWLPEPTERSPLLSRPRVCHLAWDRILIDANGDVKVCCLSRRVLGNINQSSLDDIWNGEAMQQMRKALLERDFDAAGCRELAANCRFQNM